jgi:hypothetical protein
LGIGGLDSNGYGKVLGPCKHGNELVGCIKGEKFD